MSSLPPCYSAHTAYVRSPDFFSSQSVGQFLPPVKRGFIPPGAHAPLSLACWRSTYFFLRCLFDKCLNKFFYCEKSTLRKILWRLKRTNARPLKNSNKQWEVVAINQANCHWIKVTTLYLKCLLSFYNIILWPNHSGCTNLWYWNKHMLKTDKVKSPLLCWPLVQFAMLLITLHTL